MDENRSTPYSLSSFAVPERLKKIRAMRPCAFPGNTVGTKRLGNRKGAKKRGMKAGRQRQAKVNIASLVNKANKK
jgi:hypothetical protein